MTSIARPQSLYVTQPTLRLIAALGDLVRPSQMADDPEGYAALFEWASRVRGAAFLEAGSLLLILDLFMELEPRQIASDPDGYCTLLDEARSAFYAQVG